MDSFEHLVCDLFSADGWWTLQGFKVQLTTEEKHKIGKHCSPRWEIDVLAYSPGSNELRVIECKSFLDSPGVRAEDIIAATNIKKSRYKLFVDQVLRETVLAAVERQCIQTKLISKGTKVKLCLAIGRIWSDGEEALRKHFLAHGWNLLLPSDIKKRLNDLAGKGYHDAVANLVVKLLHAS